MCCLKIYINKNETHQKEHIETQIINIQYSPIKLITKT